MMSAVTTASSVCGCRTTRRTTTTPRMTKPATMARPIDLPSTPRGSRILAPEQDEPGGEDQQAGQALIHEAGRAEVRGHVDRDEQLSDDDREHDADEDRKSTRLNSSHSQISYAVFCLKKKKKKSRTHDQLPQIHATSERAARRNFLVISSVPRQSSSITSSDSSDEQRSYRRRQALSHM